jgi:hypothetical protein
VEEEISERSPYSRRLHNGCVGTERDNAFVRGRGIRLGKLRFLGHVEQAEQQVRTLHSQSCARGGLIACELIPSETSRTLWSRQCSAFGECFDPSFPCICAESVEGSAGGSSEDSWAKATTAAIESARLRQSQRRPCLGRREHLRETRESGGTGISARRMHAMTLSGLSRSRLTRSNDGECQR